MSEVIGPCSKKQELFLSSQADVTIFGGGAGSGKSLMGVLDFLQYTHEPKFKGVITRRTTPQLMGPGGPYDNCRELFELAYGKKVRWQEKKSKFTFPSGAEIFLRHFEHVKNKEDFQGWQLSHALVDEGQQYAEEMIIYLMSRLRNPHCPVKPKIKITCNPLKESYLRQWIDWWIGPDGLPIKERDGILRWFVRKDGQMLWADSREDAIRQHGKSWLPPEHPEQVKPVSMTFLPATVYDNPVLIEKQPEYLAWLEGQTEVEKQRLLYGNWDVTQEAAGYWKREWCEIVDRSPINAIKRSRGWDIAGSLPSDVMPNPDWTAGVKLSKDKDGIYYVEDVIRFRDRFHGVIDTIEKTAREDGTETAIMLPQEPGAAGKAFSTGLVADLASLGFYARMKPSSQSKVTRFAPFAAASEAGVVKIVRADWNECFFQELEQFTGGRNEKNDQVDACGDAFMSLATSLHIPDFLPPDMSTTNPFAIR